MKRFFDVVIAAAGLLLLSPLLLILASLIRLRLGSPVLFRQTRPGFRGRPFRLIKFRTMTSEKAPDGQLLPDGYRLTSFGRFLRSTSLDELPELWNVLRGEMSIVGPRPLLMEYLPLYSADQRRRHDVRPGITGWAQVNGRNALTWEEKFMLDLWYVENRTIWLDMRILGLTLIRIVTRQGVSQPGHVTADPFRGSEGREH